MASQTTTVLLSRSLLIPVAFATGLAVGLWYAATHAVYGRLDPAVAHVGERVALTRQISFEDGYHARMELPAGTKLVWEGSQGAQHYMSIRFVLNQGDAFERNDGRPSYDFVQVPE